MRLYSKVIASNPNITFFLHFKILDETPTFILSIFCLMKKLLLTLCILIAAIGTQAQINVSATNGCAPMTINFSVPNISGAASWQWDVNGNAAGNTQSVNGFTINTPGYNYISVQVLDANSILIYNDYTYVTTYGFSSIYSGLASNTSCVGDRVSFYVNGYYPPGSINVSWDFGDGTPVVSGYNLGSEHQFSTLGNYTVTATINSSCGTTTLTYPLTVSNNAPVGNVYVLAQQDSICPGDEMMFYHPSSYNNFIMDYGDGTIESNTRNHVYNLAGTYVVHCTFINGCGNSATATDTIYVVPNIAISPSINYFSISDTTVCPSSQVNFYSPGSYASYDWNFGDGSNHSTVYNPTHAYGSVGNYSVSLTVRNGCGYTRTITRTVHVQNNIPVDPFTLSAPDSICPNTSLMIDLPSAIHEDNGPVLYLNFGDGQTGTAQHQDMTTHLYTTPGTYTIIATQVNGCGQSYSTTNTVVVNPAATLDPNSFGAMSPLDHSCPNDSIFFIVSPPDIGSFLFDFGDGNTATQPTGFVSGPDGIQYAIFKHAYASVGTYSASVQITSPCGSSVTQAAGVIDVSANNSVSNDAGFFFDESRYYCLNEPIQFIAYGASNYEWDFGDGSGSLITNYSLLPVSHAYSAPGNYNIRMIMRNSCGAVDTFFREVLIPDSYININTSTVSSHCNQEDGKAIAIVSGANAPFAYSWTNADHSFIADSLAAGIYYVTVTDARGCSTFAVATVSDQQAPTISVNNVIDANCYGEASGAIDITLIGSSAPYTYVWSNGKTTEDINQLVAGPYEVIVTDANGCHATKSVLVDQPDDFTISYVSYPSVCGFGTGAIQTSVQGSTGPYNYLWSNGYTGASLSGLSVGIYTLTVVDSKGCLKDKITSVNEQTAPIVVLDSVSALDCNISNGANVYVSTYLGTAPYMYNWNNAATTQDLTNVQPGFYSLMVTGGNGCKSILTVNVNEQIPQGLSICAVTVDSITQTNKVIWEMYSRTDIESFNIYRESSQAGLYYLVGNVDADSLHEFTDPSADPSIRGWRYKLSTVSYCGEESAKSDLHKTIHLTLNQGLGNNINLIWDNYEGLNFNKFYIWRYTTGPGWEKIDSIPSNLFSYTDLTAPSQATSPDLYYYVEGGPLTLCDPTRGAINTSRSNIKSPNAVGPTGIKSFGNVAEATVYPNPTTGMLNIHFGNSIAENTAVEVYNALGDLVSKAELAPGTQDKTFDLSALANGVYILKVRQNTGHSVQRIIISR
jgi:PKD repeat protein